MSVIPKTGFSSSAYDLGNLLDRAIRDAMSQVQSTVEKPSIGKYEFFATQPDSVTEPWLVCDGRLVKKTAYPRLFMAIGQSYSTTSDDTSPDAEYFRLPDARDKIMYGVPSGTAAQVFSGQTVSLGYEDGSPSASVDKLYVTVAIRAM